MQRHVSLKRQDFLAREFKVITVFLVYNFYKFKPICEQALMAETNLHDISDIIVLLAVVTTAPIDIRPESCWGQKYCHTQILESLDGLVPMEDLVGVLGVEVGSSGANHIKCIFNCNRKF